MSVKPVKKKRVGFKVSIPTMPPRCLYKLYFSAGIFQSLCPFPHQFEGDYFILLRIEDQRGSLLQRINRFFWKHAANTSDSRECTGNFFVDETLLRQRGVTNFDHYSLAPGNKLHQDFFLD